MTKDDSNAVEENLISEEEYIAASTAELQEPVNANSDLKELVVNYVGKKVQPEDDEVTLEMVIGVFAEEFPEFVLPIAEENFIRGYQQAMVDVEDPQFLERVSAAAKTNVDD